MRKYGYNSGKAPLHVRPGLIIPPLNYVALTEEDAGLVNYPGSQIILEGDERFQPQWLGNVPD